MKVDSRDQSLEAYIQKKEDGSLTGDRKTVYKIIRSHGPITCKKTADKMDKLPHQVSGRFTELKDRDLITEWGTVDGHTLWEIKKQSSKTSDDIIWKGKAVEG